MSFKDLRDRRRKDALTPFLEAANTIQGISFTLAIDVAIPSLFDGPAPLNLENPEFAAFREWSPATLEKAFRVVHTLSFLMAGLLREGQDVVWFTDEDAIAANSTRLTLLTKLLALISSSYLTFSLGHLRCATTHSDDGTRSIEDLVSVPDVVAGAISEQLGLEHDDPSVPTGTAFWLYRGGFSEKTTLITSWLMDTRFPLKRLFARLDWIEEKQCRVLSWFDFNDHP
jgi:hypothetical protein